MPTQPRKQPTIHSEPVRQILEQVPPWIMRWGIVILCITFGMILYIAISFEYPSSVTGKYKLLTQPASALIYTKSKGELTYSIKSQTIVEEGMVIASLQKHIQPSYSQFYKSIHSLPNLIASKSSLRQFNPQWPPPSDIKVQYQNWLSSLRSIQNIPNDQWNDILNQNSHPNDHFEKVFNKRKKILSDLKDKTLKKRLLESDLEFKKLLSKEQAHSKKPHIEEWLNFKNKSKILHQALKDFDHQYIIRSPNKGILHLKHPLKKGQQLSKDILLGVVLPKKVNHYLAEISISSSLVNRIKVGQKVYLAPDLLAKTQGKLFGRIEHILQFNQDQYKLLVSLPTKLKTDSGYEASIHHCLFGEAKILTDKFNLIDRIFNKWEKVL